MTTFSPSTEQFEINATQRIIAVHTLYYSIVLNNSIKSYLYKNQIIDKAQVIVRCVQSATEAKFDLLFAICIREAIAAVTASTVVSFENCRSAEIS
jgi:hypothetical protein